MCSELGCFVPGQIAARTDGQLDEFDSSGETFLPGLSDETPMSSGGVLDHRRSQTSLTPKRTYAIVDNLDDDEGAIRSNGNIDLVCSPMANSVRDSLFDDSADSKRVNQAFDVGAERGVMTIDCEAPPAFTTASRGQPAPSGTTARATRPDGDAPFGATSE